MNLLDMLGNDGLMVGLQLMNAGRAQPVRQNLAGGLLEALGGLQAQRNAEEDRKSKQAMQQAQLGLLGAQLDETKAQAQQRQTEAAARQADAAARAQAAQRSQQFGADLLSQMQGTTPQQALAATGGGPTPQAAAMIGQRQPMDWQALAARYPEQVDQITKLAATANLGRPEVARTIEVMGPNGPETVQFDKFGQRIGSGVAKPFELKMQDLGGKVAALNPYTGQAIGAGLGKTNTPDALLSAQTTMRGQNMTDARARENNQIARDSVSKVEWKQDVNGNFVALPKEVSGAGPVVPITTTAPGKREQQAQNALAIIDEASKLINKGTSSYIGAGVDQAARLFGAATPGAQAGAQLKALEGALMMAQPRMEGPQSDKDVALYRQMAAQIGDSTIPAESKTAALQVIRSLHARYAGQGGPAAASPAAPAGFRVLGKE